MITQRRRSRGGLLLALITFLALFAGVATLASAQTRSLTEGPVVRRLRLYRSNKIEVAPSVGTTFGPVFYRDALIGVGGRYHLTNAFSLGLTARVSPVGLNAPVLRNYEIESPVEYSQLGTSRPFVMTDFAFSYIPLHGKFNLLSNSVMHFDMHINVGAGGALLTAENNDDLGGFRFGPMVGAGFRIFIQDALALNLEVNDYVYSSLDAASPTDLQATEELGHHVVGTIGVGFFFPPEVRVSR